MLSITCVALSVRTGSSDGIVLATATVTLFGRVSVEVAARAKRPEPEAASNRTTTAATAPALVTGCLGTVGTIGFSRQWGLAARARRESTLGARPKPSGGTALVHIVVCAGYCMIYAVQGQGGRRKALDCGGTDAPHRRARRGAPAQLCRRARAAPARGDERAPQGDARRHVPCLRRDRVDPASLRTAQRLPDLLRLSDGPRR